MIQLVWDKDNVAHEREHVPSHESTIYLLDGEKEKLEREGNGSEKKTRG